MFAYGVGPCARVDLVTGPGSIWTVTAKRILKGRVGIDSEAGPTEIAILADETADPAYVAADLLSQAEHDPLAAAVLVTTSETLADEVEAELDKQVSATRHVERIRTSLGGQQSGIVLVDDVDQGVAVVDAYAAEHLEIHTAEAARSRPGCATPGRSSSARTRRSPWATTAPAATTSCPRVAAPATRRVCRCARSPSRCTSSTTRVTRCWRSPTTSSRWPRPRTCPATALQSASGWSPMTRPPLREELRAGAVRRPAARRARAAQRQREPLRPSPSSSPTSPPPWPAWRRA